MAFPVTPTHHHHPSSIHSFREFDQWAEMAQSELSGMRRNIDEQFRHNQREVEKTFQQSRPSNLMECYSLLNPIRIDEQGNRWLNCYFDLAGYKPEEIAVKLDVKEHCVCVEAAHEVEDSSQHYVKRHYLRKMSIPRDFNVDKTQLELRACLTNKGVLCVESSAPLVPIERFPSADEMLRHVTQIGVKVE